jgi:hypothetical protein
VRSDECGVRNKTGAAMPFLNSALRNPNSALTGPASIKVMQPRMLSG